MKKNIKILFLIFFTFVFGVSGLWGWEQYRDVHGPGIPVLLYHGVDSHGPKDKYTLDAEEFERQLRWLKEKGYSTVLPRDIKRHAWGENPPKTVMLSFDDGRENNYSVVLPLLQKYGFHAIFFIVTGALGEKGIITPRQLKEISSQGMEIGSHTVTHPYLDTLKDNQVEYQLQQSKIALEKITGQKVLALAPPGGWFNHTTEKIARQQGYHFVFSCEIGLNDLTQTPFVYRRIEVLRGMSLAEFQNLLEPSRAAVYKLKQSLKFFLHSIIGTDNYVKLSHAL